MPPAAKKDCGIILFDVASEKKQELLEELIKFSSYKWHLNSKSMYRLILVNSAETSNSKNYPNIFLSDIEDFNPKSLLELIENAETGYAEWLDAVLLAIKYLKDGKTMPGLITLQLIFYTTLGASNISTLSQKKISKIIKQLKENDIYFYLIGPDVNLPFTISNVESVSKCMKQLEIDGTNENLIAAKKIVSEIDTAVICGAKLGIHLLITFKNPRGTQPWRVPLTMGTELEIPACTCKIYRKDILLKLSSTQTKKYEKRLASDLDVKVEESEMVKGIVLHEKFFNVEEGMFKMNTQRCMEIIGFASKERIPEPYISGGDTYYVLPNASTNDGFQIFTHLVKVLEETGKYGVIKRVYSAGNKPKYFVLIPNTDHVPKCLTMAELPPGDNLIPHRYKEPVVRANVEEDEFSTFFNSLIIDDTRRASTIPLGPTMMMEFHQRKLLNAVANKNLNIHIEDADIEFQTLELDEGLKEFWPQRELP